MCVLNYKNKRYVIVLDTNIFLRLYSYSPTYSNFCLECLESIKNYIRIPRQVEKEFNRNYQNAFNRMNRNVDKIYQHLQGKILSITNDISKSCNEMEKMHYSDIKEYEKGLKDIVKQLDEFSKSFFDENKCLSINLKQWGGQDKAKPFFDELTKTNIMDFVDKSTIDTWEKEGITRLQNKIPPGYKDNKKQGIDRYGDFFIWMEIIEFAKKESVNIIYVSEDVKDSWVKRNDKYEFDEYLINEFSQRSNQTIIPLRSNEFFNCIANNTGIDITDDVEFALNATDDDYCEGISQKVVEKINEILSTEYYDYIQINDHSNLQYIDEFNVTSCELNNYERLWYEYGFAQYQLSFDITAEGVSSDYWGSELEDELDKFRDRYYFEGSITIEITKEAEKKTNVEELIYDSFEVIECSISEIKGDTEFVDDYRQYNGEYGVCPDCNEPLTDENYGGNGYCIKCAINH